MSIRKFFFLLSAILFSFGLKGQAFDNSGIKAKLDAFVDYSNKKQWDQAFDLLYPKLFTKVDKQDLVDLMLGMEADGMSIKMSNTRLTSTSAPLKEGTETFVRIAYVGDLNVQIVNGGLYDSQKAVQAIEEQFVATYGKGNVKWDSSKNQFLIVAHKSMIAVDSGNQDWKLVEVNLDQPGLMEYLFSPTVMETLVRI
jgi:hypothetical protein